MFSMPNSKQQNLCKTFSWDLTDRNLKGIKTYTNEAYIEVKIKYEKRVQEIEQGTPCMCNPLRC
jgi:hypothetical protein